VPNGDLNGGVEPAVATNPDLEMDQPKPAEPVAKAAAKVKVKCVDLPIKESVLQMTDADIQKFRSMEVRFFEVFYLTHNRFFVSKLELQKQDRLESEKADAKNSLEEYVYEMRDKLSDQLMQFVTEKVCTVNL